MADKSTLQEELRKVRAEHKNIRQQIESLKRVHRKDIAHVKKLLEDCAQDDHTEPMVTNKQQISDTVQGVDSEQDRYQFRPIGYIESVFTEKNGTPRQANVCQTSQAVLNIRPDLYNNPEHSLQGLAEYSHVWILFIFHKNNNSYTKPKVAPPRLNGARVGVFSTRSPYRPCPIGLSLIKLNHISGCRVHLSGVDVLAGTPVLDIKPYIPQYDNPEWTMVTSKKTNIPHSEGHAKEFGRMDHDLETDDHNNATVLIGNKVKQDILTQPCTEKIMCQPGDHSVSLRHHVLDEGDSNTPCRNVTMLGLEKGLSHTCEINMASPSVPRPLQGEEDQATESGITRFSLSSSKNTIEHVRCETKIISAKWIQTPPIQSLTVIFTNRAESQLSRITSQSHTSRKIEGEEATREAIVSILAADPRSTYRRQQCTDRLYYFTVDSLHITCWFDENVVEVLKIVYQEKMGE